MLDQNGRTVDEGYRSMSSGNGSVTTAGTAVQLANTSTQCKRVDISNPTSNGTTITIGGSNVVGTTNNWKGVPIEPGFTYTFYITDLSQVWVDAETNGNKFTYVYFW